MSVTMKPAKRTTFAGTIPTILPLYGNCETWQFPADGEWICGGHADCELHIAVEGVANRHCNFTLRAGTFTVQRIEGPIWINDLPVPRQAALMPGDTLSVGPVSFRIEAAPRPAASAAPVAVDTKAPVIAVDPANSRPARHANLPIEVASAPVLHQATAAAAPSEPLTAALLLALQQHQQQALVPAVTASTSSILEERLALLESKERILEQRELHMQELSRVAQERERTLFERGAAQDERLEILNRQKEEVEQRRTAVDAFRDDIQREKEDLNRRVQAFSEGEDQLMSQFEASASAYARLEQARAELAAQMDGLQEREREMTLRSRSLDERDTSVEQAKLAVAAQAETNTAQLTSLEERERLIQAAELQLKDREQAACIAEQKLQEAESRLSEVHQLEQSLHGQATWLKDQAEQHETLRHELEILRTQLTEQQSSLEAQAASAAAHATELQERAESLDRRDAEVAGRADELRQKADELVRQKQELEESGIRATRSVEQLTAIAAEREQAARARQEAAAALQQLNEARAAHAEELTRLESLSQEISERQSQLELEESRSREEQAQRESLQASLSAERASAELQSAALDQERLELQLERDRLTEERASFDLLAHELAEQRAALEAARELTTEESTNLVAGQQQLREDRSQLDSELARLAEERAAIQLAYAEMETRQSALDAQQSTFGTDKAQLELWQIELDSRHTELAGRLATIKAARAAMAETAKAHATAVSATAEEVVAVEQQRSLLLAREVELAQAESRVDELQRAVAIQMRNAEAEREALQNAHKDLICERNSLMQASQDIQSRSANVIEREAVVVQQMEELRSRFDALNQQEAELRKADAELNSRASELHHRVLQFKQESHELRTQHADAVNADGGGDELLQTSEPGNSVEEALQILAAHEAEEKLSQVQQERNALLTAVRELQSAMMNARADVQDAHRIRQDAAQQEQTLAGLYQTLEERSGQLQLMESQLRQANEQAESLRIQIEELSHRLDISQSSKSGRLPHETNGEFAESLAEMTGDGERASHAEISGEGESDLESHLLHELEAMRQELQAARSTQTLNILNATEPDVQTQLLLDQITELQAQLQSASQTAEGEDPVNMMQVDELRSRIDRLEGNLRDRDELIIELRTRLQKMAQLETVCEPDPAAVANREHAERELDRRVELLDEREDDLRERIRKVTQTEEDIESQRRQLLEARQQLEIARSEVQAALKQHSAAAEMELDHHGSDYGKSRSSDELFSSAILEEPCYSNSATMESAGFSNGSEALNIEGGDGSQDLRAELANLFGLKKSPPIEPIVETRPTPSPRPEFVDLSEPTGDASAVEMSFASNIANIENPTVTDSSEDSFAPREENSDDFVRDYMEQLLARSRKAAGNSLPSELKPAGQTPVSSPQNVPQPKKAAETKSPPKTKSFIDEYMSGGFKDLDAEPAAPSAEVPSDHVVSSLEPTIPRAKVDVQKQRENMNSFRTLSTQSTENALINHAMRTERLSINGRIMLTFVMVIMSVFLAIANMKGIIDHPSLIWVTVVGAFASVAELIRKLLSVKSRCKVALTPEHDDTARKNHAQAHPMVAAGTEVAVATSLKQPVPETVPEEIAQRRQLGEELTGLENGLMGRRESDHTEYFEL